MSSRPCTAYEEAAAQHPAAAKPSTVASLPSILALGALLLGVVAACAIYVPWARTPFDIIDFSEFLPFLTGHDSFSARLGDFMTYYASQGRANIVSYLFIVWKWALFGDSEPGWQLARFVQMVCIVAGVYLLLRRLESSRLGAAAGAALFIAARTASPAWMRLTMGEPLGLMLLIAAALIATRYQETPHWRASGLIIALLVAATLLTKEMLIAVVPFVLILAWTWRQSADSDNSIYSQRNRYVALLTVVATIAAGILVVAVAMRAQAGSYASDYSRGLLSTDHFMYNLGVILLPTARSHADGLPVMLQIGNVILFAILCLGALATRRLPLHARRWGQLALGGFALAVTGAAIYLPWPYFQEFYGLPFLVGPALLLALSITAIQRAHPSFRVSVALAAACLIALAQGALSAAHDARRSIGERKLNLALVNALGANSSVDSVVVALRRLPSQAWQGRGPTLGRYAKALYPDKPFPTISDAACRATLPMITNGPGNALLVSYSDQCGQFPVSTRSLRYYYRYIDWPNVSVRSDSLIVSILGPEEQR